MDKDEFVEQITKDHENVIGVEFDEDEVDIVYVTDPDTGEYDL